jgi:signal transduction histidine kinase
LNEASKKFDDHLRAVAYRNGRGAALFIAAFVGVLWPTDLVIFAGLPEVQQTVSWLRLAIIGFSLITYAGLRTRLGPRHPAFILGSGGSLAMFAIGWRLGQLGGPEQPWIELAYPALFFSVLAPVAPRARWILVVALTAALCAGFLLPHREYWHDPLTRVMLSFCGSMAVLVVAVGHLSFRILRQSFFQSLELQRASSDLAELNETLESRVRAQTRDLRRLHDHLESAREDERTRIARELHDQLGQELTAINLALALTQQRFARDPQSIKNNLGELAELLARTRGTTRNLVTELRPQLLDELGLQAGLEWLVKTTEQHAPTLSCQLNAEALDALPSELSTVAFRIVQEALTNVVRHAKAKRAEVTLAVRDGRLSLVVSDDGIGLPIDIPPRGFGLIGIRERVAARAGNLELRRRPGGGTTLAVTLPLAAAQSSPDSTEVRT